MRREVEPFAAAPCRYARADAVRGRANMHGSVAFKFATARRGVRGSCAWTVRQVGALSGIVVQSKSVWGCSVA